MFILYTFLMEMTAFPLDTDSLEMNGGHLIPSLDQGGDVPTVLQWVGGGLHGEAGGTKQVQAGGAHQLKFGECTASLHFSR